MKFTSFLLVTLIALFSGCAPAKEKPSLQTIQLVNNADRGLDYEISINGQTPKTITLQPKEGILFLGLTPTLHLAKTEFINSQGEKLGFKGTNVQLSSVQNSFGGISPQGVFSSFRYYTPEAARSTKKANWREWTFEDLHILNIKIKTDAIQAPTTTTKTTMS